MVLGGGVVFFFRFALGVRRLGLGMGELEALAFAVLSFGLCFFSALIYLVGPLFSRAMPVKQTSAGF